MVKLKKSIKMVSTLKKDFVDLEVPDKEFEGMKDGDKKLWVTEHGSRVILEIYKGKRWALFLTGYQSFGEG